MDAESMAANEGSKELAWIKKLTTDLGEHPKNLLILKIDNKATGDLIKNPGKLHKRAKHIRVQGFYIQKNMVNEGRMDIELIPSSKQPADILTKQLGYEPYIGHLRTLGLR